MDADHLVEVATEVVVVRAVDHVDLAGMARAVARGFSLSSKLQLCAPVRQKVVPGAAALMSAERIEMLHGCLCCCRYGC